jgi:hypothetical protein
MINKSILKSEAERKLKRVYFTLVFVRTLEAICLLINSLPDSVFRYFSNLKAIFSSLKAK